MSVKYRQRTLKKEEMTLQRTTKKGEFYPTPKMQEYLITAIDVLSTSPSKVSASCLVARETWYNWTRQKRGQKVAGNPAKP